MSLKKLYIFLLTLVQFVVFNVYGQNDTLKKLNITPGIFFLVDTTLNSVNTEKIQKKVNLTSFPKQELLGDSSMRSAYKTELNKDSLKSGLKEKIALNKIKKDSSLNKTSVLKKLKTAFPTGNLSLGYDYGFLPYTINMWIFHTN